MTSSINIETLRCTGCQLSLGEQAAGSPARIGPRHLSIPGLPIAPAASKILPTMILPLSPTAVLDEKMFVFKGEHSSDSR
jgi:hypothetical protein